VQQELMDDVHVHNYIAFCVDLATSDQNYKIS